MCNVQQNPDMNHEILFRVPGSWFHGLLFDVSIDDHSRSHKPSNETIMIPYNGSFPYDLPYTTASWWLNQPIWKMLVKMGIFPILGMKIKKNETTT